MTRWQKPLIFLLLLLLLAAGQGARAYSLLLDGGGGNPLSGAPAPLIQVSASVPAAPSLFTGRARGSFFEPVLPKPAAPRLPQGFTPYTGTGGATDRLLHLIASVEADPARGYDSVQYQAVIKPPLPPTRMTLDQIHAWIAATPGQQHAIGRYQIVPATLRGLQSRMALPGSTPFSARTQDAMAATLLGDAGYGAFLEGAITRTAFMNNLAMIWAGLPNASGRSHYHGLAGNRAAFSWARFEAEVAAIFPASG